MVNLTLRTIRSRFPELLPMLALVVAIVIAISPLASHPLSLLFANHFVIFVMFWILAVILVLGLETNARRAWKTALLAVCFCIAVWAVYQLIWYFSLQEGLWANVAFASLSGSVLGSMAGTWGIYFLEVYQDSQDY